MGVVWGRSVLFSRGPARSNTHSHAQIHTLIHTATHTSVTFQTYHPILQTATVFFSPSTCPNPRENAHIHTFPHTFRNSLTLFYTHLHAHIGGNIPHLKPNLRVSHKPCDSGDETGLFPSMRSAVGVVTDPKCPEWTV